MFSCSTSFFHMNMSVTTIFGMFLFLFSAGVGVGNRHENLLVMEIGLLSLVNSPWLLCPLIYQATTNIKTWILAQLMSINKDFALRLLSKICAQCVRRRKVTSSSEVITEHKRYLSKITRNRFQK
jgi:hypothetical protein